MKLEKECTHVEAADLKRSYFLLFLLPLLVTAVKKNYGEKVLIWLAAEQFKFSPAPVRFVCRRWYDEVIGCD
ncbi:unnamed protein product [Rhodiola kirilowii]